MNAAAFSATPRSTFPRASRCSTAPRRAPSRPSARTPSIDPTPEDPPPTRAAATSPPPRTTARIRASVCSAKTSCICTAPARRSSYRWTRRRLNSAWSVVASTTSSTSSSPSRSWCARRRTSTRGTASHACPPRWNVCGKRGNAISAKVSSSTEARMTTRIPPAQGGIRRRTRRRTRLPSTGTTTRRRTGRTARATRRERRNARRVAGAPSRNPRGFQARL